MAKNLSVLLASSLLVTELAFGPSGARAEDNHLLSVVKPAQTGGVAVQPGQTAVQLPEKTKEPARALPATDPHLSDDTLKPAVPPALAASSSLAAAGFEYKSNPNATTFATFLHEFRTFLDQHRSKGPTAALIKANPILTDLAVRVAEANGGRVWTFPRSSAEMIVQWSESKSQVSYTGSRRRRRKIVNVSTTWHLGMGQLPGNVTLKAAHFNSSNLVTLVGDQDGSQLWLRGYQLSNGVWQESPEHFANLPAFLKNNVCGKVAFRGPDLIFSVARIPSGSTTCAKVPEADSSTYRLWLRLTESGYHLETGVPNEGGLAPVLAFLQQFRAGRYDVARAYLADPKLLSIAKYVGIKSPEIQFRVIEMASPFTGGYRFRLITSAKDDLIFDVGGSKDRGLIIKAIFVASPDPFLKDIARSLPAITAFNVGSAKFAFSPTSQASPAANY